MVGATRSSPVAGAASSPIPWAAVAARPFPFPAHSRIEVIMSQFNSILPAALTRRALALGVAGGALATMLPGRAHAATPQVILDQAQAVIADAKHDPQFGTSGALFHQCRAVMIVPQLVKGGFFVGGEGGEGVMIAKSRGGAWGQPAFYAIGSASFGLQIGLEVSELVMFIMSERALQGFMSDKFKIGAGAGLTVLVVGSAAQAALTAGGADIIAWAKSKGAYGGITLEGSIIQPLGEANAAYYGRPVNAQQIVNGTVTASSWTANGLRRSLMAG